MRTLPKFTTFIASAGLFAAAPSLFSDEHEASDATTAFDEAIAVLDGTSGYDVQGVVTFREKEEGVIEVKAEVSGLKPNQSHAIHIHQFGDLSAVDGTKAGGHFNPEGHDHGLPGEDAKRHSGDLGNIQADENGNGRLLLEVSNIELHGATSILGRAIIVHEGKDTGAQPTGEAGSRIAQGVIGIRHPDTQTEEIVEEAQDFLGDAVEALRKAGKKVEEKVSE